MIDINNLKFGYKKGGFFFDDFSLSVSTGKIVGLLGRNGAGKTTLLKIISGLLHPNNGHLDINGYNPKNGEASFLSDLFFVPEEFDLPSVSIESHTKANAPFYPHFDQELFEKLLGEFDLSKTDSLHKVSHGTKKKYFISFALATRSRLMLLDEPTNGLDIPSKIIFRKVLAGALDDHQLVFISTHQVKDVENLIDTIVMLDDGKLIMHRNLMEISELLKFGQAIHLDEEVLYSEVCPAGYNIIKTQTNGHSSVNIELLFNALSTGTKLFEYE